MTYVAAAVSTTYRASTGRRYLTRINAYKASARAIIKKRCDACSEACEGDWCEDAEHDGDGWLSTGNTCRRHKSPYNERLIARLVRWMMWRDAQEVSHG